MDYEINDVLNTLDSCKSINILSIIYIYIYKYPLYSPPFHLHQRNFFLSSCTYITPYLHSLSFSLCFYIYILLSFWLMINWFFFFKFLCWFYTTRVNGHSAQAQPVVGWPPVRTFRRNLAGSQATKQEMESEKEAKKAKSLMEMEKVANNINHVQSKPTMFVKVNMEGYAVGRKIDLKAHDSYDSLSKSLQKMFQNFLSG